VKYHKKYNIFQNTEEMADSKEHDKSAGSTNSSDDALNWELEDIDSNKEMFAKLVARMDALETENKLADELKGLDLAHKNLFLLTF
jgi:hypothetical protein